MLNGAGKEANGGRIKKWAGALGRHARRLARGASQGLESTARRIPDAARKAVPVLSRSLHDLLPPAPEPPPPRGFFYVAHLTLEIIKRIEQRSVFVLPGGVAFFLLLGLLPAAAAVASIYGLVANPDELVALSDRLPALLPAATAALISEVLTRVAEAPRSSLGLSAAIALFMTLMSANWSTKALCEALNIVFDRHERRNYFEFTGVTLLMTTVAALVTGAYAWVHFQLGTAGISASLRPWLVTTAEAATIWVLLTLAIGALYRYGPAPDPSRPASPIITVGSVIAAFSVLAASWLLSQQFATSGTFVRNFGPLASIAAIVVWTWVIVVLILLGAEIVEIREEESRKRTERRRHAGRRSRQPRR